MLLLKDRRKEYSHGICLHIKLSWKYDRVRYIRPLYCRSKEVFMREKFRKLSADSGQTGEKAAYLAHIPA